MESACSDAAHRRPKLGPRPERNSVVPPFWQRHERTNSALSFTQPENSPIRLEDHSEAADSKHLWAKHVAIDDYVIIGSPPAIGAYVVWNCTVETLDVSAPQQPVCRPATHGSPPEPPTTG